MRIPIDLNRRAEDGSTVVSVRTLSSRSLPFPGEVVTVFEPEDGVKGRAIISEVDEAAGLIFLFVDWSSIEDDVQSVALRPTNFLRYKSIKSAWADSLTGAWSLPHHGFSENPGSHLTKTQHPTTSNRVQTRAVVWA